MKNFLKDVTRLIFRFGNIFLGWCVEPLIAVIVKPSHFAENPIFIIGAPRSGTTLTFQLITHTLNVGYLSNLHSYVYGAPALASFFTRRKKRIEDYKSNHGRTSGLFGPSECGAWWYRFFRRAPVYVTKTDVTTASMKAFKRSLAGIAAIERRPIVFKNLYAGMRLEPIANQFPGALFIHVQRDLRDNAHSILEGRMKANGSYQGWWSVPPPGHEALHELSPERQVVEQIRLIGRQIHEDIDRLGIQSRVMTARYEDICLNPKGFINSLETFLLDVDVKLHRQATPPEKFSISSQKNKISPELDKRLDTLVKETGSDD